MSGCYEHGIELWGAIKFGEFLDELREDYILRKNFALWS
jgi:hypothetical protein